MTGAAFALFETSIGRCAIAWRGGLLVSAGLAATSDDALRSSIAARHPQALESAPPPVIAAAIDGTVRLLSGERVDLASVEVDLSGAAPFERDVYAATRDIPCGEVRTYGEVAAAIGSPGAARAVGRALGCNPLPIVIPCHRVLASGGKGGGFSAPGGTSTKFRMLEIEGARLRREPELFETLPLAVRP